MKEVKFYVKFNESNDYLEVQNNKGVSFDTVTALPHVYVSSLVASSIALELKRYIDFSLEEKHNFEIIIKKK